MRPLARLLPLVLLAASGPRPRAAEFQIAPSATWVAPLPVDVGPAVGAEGGDAGDVEYLLVDAQVHVAREIEHHRHVAMRVRTPSGIERAAELRVDFDPTYQRLVLHGAWVWRGGRRTPALRSRDVRIVQRETDLDRRLFDGTRTAVLYLRDVRVGDVVEYAYSIAGENPVLGGHFADVHALAYGVPVGRLRVRVLWGGAAPLRHRVRGLALAPAERAVGAEQEFVWDRAQVAGIDGEDRLPPGVTPWPELELTDFDGWGEVARWALPLYPRTPLSPQMRAQVEIWKKLPTEVARATAALRFVQDEVRYLGIEMGERSHRPHPPPEVFARRFGDCKDKSFLLVTLLDALGIEAFPALVHTEEREAVAERLPTPFTFDHVIVRATLGGEVRWLEPTRSYEHAPADAVRPPPYGRALVIRPGAEAFEPLPAAVPALAAASLTYRVERYGAPVRMEVVTTLQGMRALAVRSWIAEDGLPDLQKSYLQHYGDDFPGIRADGPLVVEDAPDADRVVVHETYVLPAVDAGGEQAFVADLVDPELQAPQSVVRKLPLAVHHPVELREEVRIELPGPPAWETDHQVIATPAARFERGIEIAGRVIHARFEYRSLQAAVAPAQVGEHAKGLRRMREYAGFTAPLAVGPAPAPTPASPGADDGAAGVPLLAVGLCVGLAAVAFSAGRWRAWFTELRQRRRRRSFAARFVAAPGDSPAAPLPVPTEAELPWHVGKLRCGCGGRLAAFPLDRSEVVYGGATLVTVLLPCERCPERRRVYLAVGRR